MAAVFMAIGAVISLVTIISIYREGGILKRLRATPLRPQTILSAHVLVKLLFTAVSLTLMMLAGRRYYPAGIHVPVDQFRVRAAVQHAVDPVDRFVIASLVRTARFAQPVGALVFYPMIGAVRPVRAGRRVADRPAVRREAAADDLRRLVAARHLERRVVVRASGRSRRPGDRGCGLRRDLVPGIPLGSDRSKDVRRLVRTLAHESYLAALPRRRATQRTALARPGRKC